MKPVLKGTEYAGPYTLKKREYAGPVVPIYGLYTGQFVLRANDMRNTSKKTVFAKKEKEKETVVLFPYKSSCSVP